MITFPQLFACGTLLRYKKNAHLFLFPPAMPKQLRVLRKNDIPRILLQICHFRQSGKSEKRMEAKFEHFWVDAKPTHFSPPSLTKLEPPPPAPRPQGIAFRKGTDKLKGLRKVNQSRLAKNFKGIGQQDLHFKFVPQKGGTLRDRGKKNCQSNFANAELRFQG